MTSGTNAVLCYFFHYPGPVTTRAATGGLLSGDQAVICGGQSSFSGAASHDMCYVLGQDQTVKMTRARSWAASVVYEGKLLVTGGKNDQGALRTTEWIIGPTPQSSGHSSNAGDLATGLHAHSMELYRPGHAIIIGGYSDTWGRSSKTYVGNLSQKPIRWIEGPRLTTPRYYHASALLKDGSGGASIVVSGGWDGSSFLDSVEMMSEELGWKAGTRLPKAIRSHSMVSLRDKIVLLGGYDGVAVRKEMYQLDCPSCHWNKLQQTLEHARSIFVSFPIPNQWSTCEMPDDDDYNVYLDDELPEYPDLIA